MTILWDARAAYLYPGTGLGTYSRQILLQFLQSGLNSSGLALEYWSPHRRVSPYQLRKDLIVLSNSLSKDPRFWSNLVEHPVKAKGDQIVHLPNNGLGGQATLGAKQVVTIHDLIPLILPETCSKEYLRIFASEMPRILERSTKIIAVSEHTRRDIERTYQIPTRFISVIHEAPDPIYRPLNSEATRTVLAEGYGLDYPFLLYVGGFSPRKNLTALIRAFARVRKDLVTPHLLVILGLPGKGSYPDCRKLVSRLRLERWVRFPGFIPTRLLPLFYNAASSFIYPSLYEGFGLPPIEAMACGTPTITSNRSSLPEVVGEGALQVDPDPISLAEAIADVINQPEIAEKLHKLGLQRVKEFSWRTAAQHLNDLYTELLGGEK
ncbi:MAG TPA: glycosyltransferase family 1 protein [Bacillota bacterium]|nr:glycosyltransferase family 1 protein [Bacillota bacterium]